MNNEQLKHINDLKSKMDKAIDQTFKQVLSQDGTKDREALCGEVALKSLGLYGNEHKDAPVDVEEAIVKLREDAAKKKNEFNENMNMMMFIRDNGHTKAYKEYIMRK